MIPKYFFLTKGVGKHKENLASFELALRDAGIQHCNLVPVSSIIPPGCKLIPKEKGIPMLHPGEITFVVLARNCTDEPHRLIASTIGIAIPSEENQYGYLSEHHSFGQSDEIVGDYSEDLANRRPVRRPGRDDAGDDAGHPLRRRQGLGRARAAVQDER